MVINGLTVNTYSENVNNGVIDSYIDCSLDDIAGWNDAVISIGNIEYETSIFSVYKDTYGWQITFKIKSREQQLQDELNAAEAEVAERDAKLNSIKEALNALGDSVTIAKLKAFVEAVKDAVADVEMQNDE